jgi:hypothetical protein
LIGLVLVSVCINYFYNLDGIVCVAAMTESITFSAIVWKEGKLQIAWSPELDIASQGKNVEEAQVICGKQSSFTLKMKTQRFQLTNRLFLPL